MLFPYNTDAPLYHWPYATVGLIAANVVAFIFEMGMLASGNDFDASIRPWCLELGGTIKPWQWVTSVFMHYDIFHLLGNMLFLWTFGLIVEGKIGWWRFLLIFLGIGAGESMIEQVLFFFGPETFSLGASSAIFGVMAIALIWAPVNEVSAMFLLIMYPIFFELKVATLAGFFLIENLLVLFISGFALGSSMLHILGVLIGVPIGFFLLLQRRVNCEGYDILTVLKGKEGQAIKTREEEKHEKLAEEKYEQEKSEALQVGQQQVNAYLKQGHIDMALARFKVMKNYDKRLQLSEQQLYELIRGLHTQKRWKESLFYMHQYIQQNGKHQTVMRLKLAQLLLVEFERPKLALDILKQSTVQFSADQQRIVAQLEKKAKQMFAEGHIEIDDPLF